MAISNPEEEAGVASGGLWRNLAISFDAIARRRQDGVDEICPVTGATADESPRGETSDDLSVVRMTAGLSGVNASASLTEPGEIKHHQDPMAERLSTLHRTEPQAQLYLLTRGDWH